MSIGANSVCLAMAWMPRGEQERLRRFYPQLQALYSQIVVAVPPDADAEALAVLKALPDVQIEGRIGWESGRLIALEMARNTGADFIHYVDGDRLIHWIETRPDELRLTIEAVQTVDYLVIGRTPAAMETHPQALQQTETITNTVFSHLVGQPLDLCAGSKGLSHKAVDFVVHFADSRSPLGTDAEWVVLLHRGGFSIKSLLVDGLDWETADRYLAQAADAETQRRIAEAYDADGKNWAFRVRVAQETAEAGLAALTHPLKDFS